jgi:hypothetical protein
MRTLSESDERRLLDGVKSAVSLVDDQGMTPNAALRKVAEQFEYSPGFLKAACNAFNTGRQLAQWNGEDSILDKLASFPLADYDAIHSEMWGSSNEKTAAVSNSSLRFRTYDDIERQTLMQASLPIEKQAAETEVHPLVADEQAVNRLQKASAVCEFSRRKLEAARAEKTAAEGRLNFKIQELGDYFAKFAHDRLSFAQVEYGAATYFGEAGKALMDCVADRFPNEKRASAYPRQWNGFFQPVDRNREPYTMIAAVIKQADAVFETTSAFDVATKKLAEAEAGLLPFVQPRQVKKATEEVLTTSLIPDAAGEKKADMLSGLAGGFGMGLGAARSFDEQSAGTNEKKLESQIADLESPEHLNELRKIRAQTVLTQMMSDPENPVSGYDPEEVLHAYNEMVQLSPRLADQPAAVGPLLNKRLAGHTEPFEIGETLKLEQGLKDTQAPPSSTANLMKNDSFIR